MNTEVLQSGALIGNLFSYNGYKWQPQLCILSIFTMAFVVLVSVVRLG